MDATQFRERAARAREMAKSGDDLRLSRMLLDVARDLDAEAEAMEAETPAARIGMRTFEGGGTNGDHDIVAARVIDLGIRGARVTTDSQSGKPDASMPDYALHLEGTIGAS